MKRFTTTIILGSMFLVAFSLYSPNRGGIYYYAFYEKVPLSESKTKVLIRLEDPSEKIQMSNTLRTVSASLKEQWRDDKTLVVDVSDETKKQDLMAEIAEMKNVRTVQPVYLTKKSLEMGVGDDIVVKYKAEISLKQISEIHRQWTGNTKSRENLHHVAGAKRGRCSPHCQ